VLAADVPSSGASMPSSSNAATVDHVLLAHQRDGHRCDAGVSIRRLVHHSRQIHMTDQPGWKGREVRPLSGAAQRAHVRATRP